MNILIFFCLLIDASSGFLPSSTTKTVHGPAPRHPESCSVLMMVDPDVASMASGCSMWTAAIETFDGSTIVNPVIVSDAFWSGLGTKILSVLIGQFLAFLAFAGLASVAGQQISSLANLFTSQLGGSISSKSATAGSNTSFRKLPTTPPVQADFGKLLICLVIDILGSSSELIPVLGEATDLLYAPIAAVLLRQLYGSNVAFGLEFVEEILPFTDIIPLATICWAVDTYYPDSDLARLLQLGNYGTQVSQEEKVDAIDVNVQDARFELGDSKRKDTIGRQ